MMARVSHPLVHPGPGSGGGAGAGAARSRSRSGSGYSRSGCCCSGAGTGERGPERAARGAGRGPRPGGATRAPPRAGAPRRRRARRHGLRPRFRLRHSLPLPRNSGSSAVPVEPRPGHSVLLRASRGAFLPDSPCHRHNLRRGLDHRTTDLECRLRIGWHHDFHGQRH